MVLNLTALYGVVRQFDPQRWCKRRWQVYECTHCTARVHPALRNTLVSSQDQILREAASCQSTLAHTSSMGQGPSPSTAYQRQYTYREQYTNI